MASSLRWVAEESDETFTGRLASHPKNVKGGRAHKHEVLTHVERGGVARSFMSMERESADRQE